MLNAIIRLHYAHTSSQMPPRIRLRTAYHEAGHGYFMTQSPLWKNVRLMLNSSGGLARSEYYKRNDFCDAEAGWLIAKMTIAGAVTEQFFFGNYSKLGAAQDVNNSIQIISGRESVISDFIEDGLLPTSFAAVESVVPEGTSTRTQSILGGAVMAVSQEIAANAARIRNLGKALYKRSYLSDREVRQALETGL